MEIIDNYLYFDSIKNVVNKKKMTGHDFVELANLSEYNKPGDKILSMLGIYKKEFDNKYSLRGAVAENLVMAYYKKRENRDFLYYDEATKKKNGYDFFPTYKQCGGIPDLEMLDKSEIIEIKSKSMNKYDEIAIKENIPLEELYQGLYYGYLRDIREVTMFYVFFDEETENLIFENKKPNTLKNIKLYKKTFNMSLYKEDIESKIKECLKYYNDCIRYKRIPLNDISPNVLKSLDIIKGYDINEL